VQARRLGFAARRRFWETFTRHALARPGSAPSGADLETMLGALDTIAAEPPAGRVSLVGAGPGDPDLLTVKALRALQSADVILYDDLVPEAILELARREARRICVGKTGHGPSCRQPEIDQMLVRLAREGSHVVRLKSGDPQVFGRATEEIAACRAAGISVAIIPGISAAQAAGAALGISLTGRHTARRLQFVTGHSSSGILPDTLDWRAIADADATTVVYMPRRTLEAFRDKALESGLDPLTPAAALVNLSRADEACVMATLADLPRHAAALASGPMLVVLGRVLKTAELAGHGQMTGENAMIGEYYSQDSLLSAA
jgi:uroporphyrin-III C-methyltransferase / precorrin-2 dehydrogenase / sirohydrochlorin ferrochelatase